jgi:hypothetical protein
MNKDPNPPILRLASVALVLGGLLMALLWLIFTTVHGPTSYNQDRAVLGRSMHFWGSMLGGPPNLLVAFGLGLLCPCIARRASRLARVGYTITMVGLLVPAGIDLVVGALGAPFFVPALGIGLLLLTYGNWHTSRLRREHLYLLLIIGSFLVIAFAWALVPLHVSDQIGGYRIFGLLAHFVTGIGWAVLGVRFWQTRKLLGVSDGAEKRLIER